MKKLLLLVVISTLFCTPVSAQENRLTPELLWKFWRITAHDVSPNGQTVVFAVRRMNAEQNKGYNFIYTIPTAGGAPVLIADSIDNGHSPVWNRDGSRIMFMSSRSGTNQVWQMHPDGSEKRLLSTIFGGIGHFGFNNAGDRLWMSADVPVKKTVHELYEDLPHTSARIYDDLMFRHWDRWEDESYSHIFYASYKDDFITTDPVDIMIDEPYDSPLAPFGGGTQITWSPDGDYIAYTCKKYEGTAFATNTDSDIYLFNIQTGEIQNLTKGMMGYDTYPAFSPDGTKLTWLSMETPMFEADRNRIFQYTFKTKTKTELTKGFDYTVNSYKWSPDGKYIYFTSGINATVQLWILDPSQKAGNQIRQLTNDMADISSFSFGTRDGKPVIVTSAMSISRPNELFVLDPETGISSHLTNVNKLLAGTIEMGKVEKRMVKATDGKEILTWVIYPPGFDPSKKYPTLLYCQGGPQSTVSQFFSYRWNFQLMAANGYIVVAPNRRGLPSFGTEWNRQISGDWGGQAMQDLLSAIDDVSNEPYVDKEKLGAVGASFGGYSVYWLAGNHNKRFKSFISHCGVFNLESMYGTTEELFFADFDMGGPYFKNPKPKAYGEFNPINYVDNWDTPILIIHNDLDFRVPISQGMEAFTAARLKGIPARFLSFSDENHWVTKPQNGILWQRVFFEWLDKYLK